MKCRKAVAVIVMIAAFCLFTVFPAAAKEQIFVVEIMDAKIKSTAGINGECTVSFDKDTVTPCLGVFSMPGAYAEIELTIKNTGSLNASLIHVDAPFCSLEDFSVTIADDLKGELLQTGEACTLTVIVAWNKDSGRSFEKPTQGDYTFRLLYISDEAMTTLPGYNNNDAKSSVRSVSTPDSSESKENGNSVQTGEAGRFSVALLAVLALGYAVIKLRDTSENSRKTKEE